MLKKRKKVNSEEKPLPPEILGKIFMQLGMRSIKCALIYEAGVKVVGNYPEIWNTFCGTTGLTKEKCISILKNDNALIKAIKRKEERLTIFNTGQSDMTHLVIHDRQIYTSSDDQSLRVFTYEGCLVKNYTGHTGGIWTFDILKNKPITGSTDKTARIWSMENGTTLRILKYHRSTIRVLKCYNEFIITGSRDNTIGIWNEIGDLLYRLEGHAQSVRCLDVCDDYLVSGSYDGMIKLWDYKKGRYLRDICAHDRRVYCVKLYNGYIASGGHDTSVKISRVDGTYVASYKYSTSIVAWIDFQGNSVISSSLDGLVVKFNYISREQEFKIQEESPIRCQKVNGGILIIGTMREVKIYSVYSGALIRTLIQAYLISKVEVDTNHVVVGYMHEGQYKIAVFDYKLDKEMNN